MRQVNVSIPAHHYAPTQDVVADHLCRTGTKRHNSRCPGLFIHDPAKELPRIPLPRTRVNKDEMKGRDYSESEPSRASVRGRATRPCLRTHRGGGASPGGEKASPPSSS